MAQCNGVFTPEQLICLRNQIMVFRTLRVSTKPLILSRFDTPQSSCSIVPTHKPHPLAKWHAPHDADKALMLDCRLARLCQRRHWGISRHQRCTRQLLQHC